MNYILDKTLTWIGNNKLATFFGVCLFCFIITTIVISSQKSSLSTKLAECEDSKKPTDKPPTSSSSTTSTTTSTTTTTTTTTKKPDHDTSKSSSTSTTKHPNGDGGEGSMPDQLPSKSSFIANLANDEGDYMNDVEDSYDGLHRIAKRFVPILANA